MSSKQEEQETTKVYGIVALLAAVFVALIVGLVMPTLDALREAAKVSHSEFYRECMPKDGERVVVESHAGNWQCPERHAVVGYGMARK